jgi:hypothetical protein
MRTSFQLPSPFLFIFQRRKNEKFKFIEIRKIPSSCCCSYLTSTNFAEAAFAQDPIHAERFVCDGLIFEPLPLQISVEASEKKLCASFLRR